MSDGAERGFLSRWSRRKDAARQGDAAGEPADPAEPAADGPEAVPQDLDTRSEAEILAALDLPDPDTLTTGSDFRAFMAVSVPAAIRNRALRVLWRSDPRLANLDGLVDHGEDFTDKATVRAGMKTAYQVGKGMLRRIAESEPAEPPAAETEPAPPPVETPAGADRDDAVVERPEAVAPEEAPAGGPASPARTRRMRFEVSEATTEVGGTAGQRE